MQPPRMGLSALTSQDVIRQIPYARSFNSGTFALRQTYIREGSEEERPARLAGDL